HNAESARITCVPANCQGRAGCFAQAQDEKCGARQRIFGECRPNSPPAAKSRLATPAAGTPIAPQVSALPPNHSPYPRPIANRTRLAAPNKCLAQSNKSCAGGEATKKRNPQ